ncbi:glycoside hydrolase family protein [Methylobacterium sp. OAE515]|uniref:glycoside hydrolase family protein n=1 Tax=Methylobacterium sp. OAE515 TaxID=2817895 RepID=UPI001789B095
MTDRLKNLLIFEEGRVVRNGLHVAYRDSKGIATIGYGFNLEAGAYGVLRSVTTKSASDLIAKSAFLTEAEAQSLLLLSEYVALKGVRTFFRRFDTVDLPRKVVLTSMVYQMGQSSFGKFHRLIEAVKVQDWNGAVVSMENSKWSRIDSPLRARRMTVAMRSGLFPASAVPSPPGQRFAVPGMKGVSGGSDQPTPAPAGPRKPWPFDNE